MHEIEMQEMSEEFFPLWQAAGMHLNKQVDGGIRSWLRAHPYPPVLEHLSFRLGNQLFVIRIEDASGKIQGPGSLHGLLTVAHDSGAHACVMPMRRSLMSRTWEPDSGGWGLLDARTRAPINPVLMVTDEKIEMTRWELQDMAVQVVREQLEKSGAKLMSWQGNPDVDPSIWCVGKSGKPEWVVVRATRYPANRAERPATWAEIAHSCQRMSSVGHFASVAVASKEQPFASDQEPPVPLWRGHGLHVRFDGLE